MAAAEQKKSYQVVKQFKGINTKANRTAIEDTEFSWLENSMPVGYGNLKTIPAPSSLNIAFANTVTYFFSANIGLTDYLVAFEQNGGAEYVNLATNTKGTIAAPGTFSTENINITQWKNQYVLIADPIKGYFTWDGNSVVTIGSVGSIGLTNRGSGYTSAPTVQISAPNQANGVQATAVCSISSGSGSILSIGMTNVGTGYTSIPNVTIGAPNLSNGVQALASATIQGGGVVAISVTTPGTGYTSAPSVTITGGGGSNAAANAVVDTGIVTSISLVEAGTGYTSAPTVTLVGGGGSNATAVAGVTTFAQGAMGITVTNGGSNYINAANTVVTITGGGGTNAAGTAILSGGQVTQVIMTNPGSGYTNAANITVTITGGGGSNATAIASVTTDKNSGIATFSGRVWISQGRTVYYSAAGSVSDFTSVSAGAVTISDATLHGNIQQLLSANNFLYIFGDDSINVFSDVRVTNTGTTLFTNTNVSASVGSKLAYALFPYFRSVLFMNNYGVYALVGSTTSKISDALDGVFPNIDFVTEETTAGQVLLNNILCAAFNFKYVGGQGTSASPRFMQAIFFEKKWFFTSQGDDIKYITSAPVGGKTNLYGTNGTNCVQLYADANAAISSYVQTALMPMGDNIRTKQALKVGVEATLTNSTQLSVTVDSESGPSPTYVLGNYVTWYNNLGVTITWLNNSSATIGWFGGRGYTLYKTDAQQYGKYLGMTVTSTYPNFVLNGFEYEHELRVRF
jgi:hypothetical protein